MKKYITSLVMMAMMAVSIPMLAGSAEAQRRYRTSETRYYGNTYDNGYYPTTTNSGRPNVYDRHRQAINIGGGAVAGALLGALLGGRKGALIGGAIGAAGGAIVTKKQSPRNYYRYRY